MPNAPIESVTALESHCDEQPRYSYCSDRRHDKADVQIAFTASNNNRRQTSENQLKLTDDMTATSMFSYW